MVVRQAVTKDAALEAFRYDLGSAQQYVVQTQQVHLSLNLHFSKYYRN